MDKVIFVLVDALGFDAAVQRAGFAEHLVAFGDAAKYRVECGLPSSSRPMYETLMTGLPVAAHGVSSNQIVRPSRCENLFSLTKKFGLRSAAAAYCWMSELYTGRCPFDLYRDRVALEQVGDVGCGIFYNCDSYPDSHLYADAEFLRTRFQPHFLLVHPMNVDDQGHRFTAQSVQYHAAVDYSFDQIAQLYERWREDGYAIVITGDHGMDGLGLHGGNTPMQREVPLYIISDKIVPGDFCERSISNLNIAPLLCALLGIPRGEKMLENLDIVLREGAVL